MIYLTLVQRARLVCGRDCFRRRKEQIVHTTLNGANFLRNYNFYSVLLTYGFVDESKSRTFRAALWCAKPQSNNKNIIIIILLCVKLRTCRFEANRDDTMCSKSRRSVILDGRPRNLTVLPWYNGRRLFLPPSKYRYLAAAAAHGGN